MQHIDVAGVTWSGPELTTATVFTGVCGTCGKHLGHRPLGRGRAYPPRLPILGVTCRCDAKATLTAEGWHEDTPPA